MASPTLVWIFGLCVIILLLVGSAQVALVYIDRARLRHMLEIGTPRARALTRVLEEPGSSLSAILLVTTAAQVVAAVAGFDVVRNVWLASPALAVIMAAGAWILLVLVQLVGRLIAVRRPESIALTLVRPVQVLTWLVSPILWPILLLDRAIGRILGMPGQFPALDAEDRLRALVEEDTELERNEREMIAGVIELGVQPVREIMVPRMDMVALPDDSTTDAVLDSIVASGHSRLPLFHETVDNVTGVIYAKDLLRQMRDHTADQPASGMARQPYVVPETKKVDNLLHEMQSNRVHLAIVVDEYGGTAGLITLEDLVEEIVGEIQDEYDVEESRIQVVSPEEAIFEARVSLRDVNDTLDIDLGDEDVDTLGGLLYVRLGRVPSVGDEVHEDGVNMSVLSTAGRRVRKVRVVKNPRPELSNPGA